MKLGQAGRTGLAALALAALVWAAFGGAVRNGFVRFDDHGYVYENSMVVQGLTADGVRWAFTTGHMFNWHPLTWLSHMADVELYGLDPAGHHATSLLLHAANAILLFLVLRRMTGRFWPAFAAAALWAVHPLRVESVAWVAERKDVLSAFFALGALHFYRRRMAWTALAFALSLLAKPSWVTLPFLLLLLDVWPLRRWPGESPAALVREKVPLFLLAALSCVATFVAQHVGGAVQSFADYPFGVRLANAAVACAQYVLALAWPFGLSVFYPHPGAALPAAASGAAAAGLALVSFLALRAFRRRPWWTVGWLWFLGSLVPMIGLVQVGWQARADRYTYLPHVGLIVALVWTAAEAAHGVGRRRILAVVSGLLAVALVLLARRQTAVWRDSETLFRHAIELRADNALAQYNLGTLQAQQGRFAEALPRLRLALRAYPERADVLNNLAWLLASDPASAPEQMQEARELAQRAIACAEAPDASLLDTLAVAQAACGDFAAAAATARAAYAQASAAGDAQLAANVRRRLAGYEVAAARAAGERTP